MKRFLSILLVLCLVAAWLPAGALAQENEIPEQLSGSWINPLYADVIGPEDLPELQIQPQKKSGGSAYYEDPASAAAVVREAMENRSGSVSFGYMIPKDDYSNEGLGRIAGAILDYACAHTGVPTQGDYLTWQYGGASFGAQAYGPNGDGSAYYSDITFNLRYYTTAQQEATVTQAVKELLATLNPTGSDYQKLTTVYDWICDNIVYDYDNLYNDAYTLKYSAYAALINRTAVCQGYSLLLYRLALEMGIDCRIISGIGITNEGSGDHAWNILKVGGKYYNADATWDINFCANDDYRYYLLNEANFSPKHVRDAEYSTSAFFGAYPMGESNYDPSMEPEIPEEPEVPQIPSGTCGENLTWTLKDGVLTISGTGEMERWHKEDSAPWAAYRDQITSVVLEEGVTNIGPYAFYNCSNLTNVVIPDGVTHILDNSFQCCSSLTSVVIPDTVVRVGTCAFNECTSLTDVVIGSGLAQIEVCTFSNCSSLKQIVIPDNITYISYLAFDYCTALEEVTIGANVEQIGFECFNGCESLKTVYFVGGAPENGIGMDAFGCVEADVYYPRGDASWTADAMQNYGGTLTWVPYGEMPTSGSCGANTTWNFADGVLTLSGTGAIDSYESEAPWESFGDQIQTLVIEEGVTTIGEYNFVGLMGLTDIYLPASLEYIGPNAFVYGMGDNIENVYIPDLGAWCAVECANYYWSNPLSYAENLYVNGEIVTDLVIPEGTTRIGDNIFGSTWMFESLVIPESVTSIGSRAFFGCETLKTVTIHANLDSVGEYAFHMSGVQTVTFTGDAPADYENLFNFYNSVVTVYYPAANDTWDEVVAADLWNIEFIPGDGASTSGTCGDNLTWNLTEGVLTISGTGDMYDYEDGWDPEAYVAPWSGLEFGTVIIEEGVTGIGNNAFMWSGVNTVSIADSVTSIGEGAFAFCQWMTEVNLPANLTELGDNAFGVCVALKNVTIPGSVKTIGCAAFSGCEWLESVVIEEGVEVIGESAFSFCGMSSIVLPETITNIGMGAFAYCYNLKEITVPASVNRIDSGAFDATGDSLTITFCGSAPVFEGNEEGDIILGMVPVTCYYPAGDASWTAVIPTVHGSVTWISYGEEEIIPGDMDGDGVLDDKDVAQLLWHTLFPASFAICGDADFNHDGVVDDADVAYLLWHTLFPNAFPL